MAPHNNKVTNKNQKQRFGKSLQKKPSGLQKNQPAKKEERVTVDQVINENIAKKDEEEDEEEAKKRKEEERQKWLEEQRIKYPIAPDGYIPNSVVKKRLGTYNPRVKNESHALASDNHKTLVEAKKEFQNGCDDDEHWHLPFADQFISIESIDQRGGDSIVGRRTSSKSKYRKEKISFSEVDTLIRETPLVDDPLEVIKEDEVLPSVESGGFFIRKSDDLQMSNSEQTPHELSDLDHDSASLERNIESNNGILESSAKKRDEERAAFYGGDDDDDDDDENLRDHYSYRQHGHKDGSDKLLKISGDLDEVPEEDEAYDDFLGAGQPEAEFKNFVEEDASACGKIKADIGSTETGLEQTLDQTKTSKMCNKTSEVKKMKTNSTIRRKQQLSTTPEVNFRIKLCQQNDSDHKEESPVVERSSNKSKEIEWDLLKQAANNEDESILIIRKIKTRTDFENERKAEMYDVVNDNENILDADKQNKQEFKTKTITYVGIVKRNKLSGDDEVHVYSPMKFITQSNSKSTESQSQGHHLMLHKKEDSGGHAIGRNWKNVCNARSVSADRIEKMSKLPSIEGINRIHSAGIELARQSCPKGSKPNSGSSLMSSTLTNQTSGNSNKFNTFSPATNGEDSFTNDYAIPLPKITTSSKFGGNHYQSSSRRHHCLYSKLVRMHLHDHISLAKHLRTMELYASTVDTTKPLRHNRYGDVLSWAT